MHTLSQVYLRNWIDYCLQLNVASNSQKHMENLADSHFYPLIWSSVPFYPEVLWSCQSIQTLDSPATSAFLEVSGCTVAFKYCSSTMFLFTKSFSPLENILFSWTVPSSVGLSMRNVCSECGHKLTHLAQETLRSYVMCIKKIQPFKVIILG